MANNYSQTSFVLECNTHEEALDVLKFANVLAGDGDADSDEIPENIPDDDMDACGDLDLYDAGSNTIWFRDNGEGFNSDYFDTIIRYAIKKFKLKPMGYTWANTCSKPRLDEFDGGAAFFKYNPTTDNVDTDYTAGWLWLRDKIAESA
jgi:hypothetical protein